MEWIEEYLFLGISASYRVPGKYITWDSVYFLFLLGLCPSDQSREKWRQFWEFDNAWLVIQRDAFDLTHLPLFRPSFLSKQTNIFLISKFNIKQKVRRKNFILERIAPKHENFLKWLFSFWNFYHLKIKTNI